MGYLSRQPTSNDMPKSTSGKSPWLGETEDVDEFVLRLQGKIKKCTGPCGRQTHIKHLDKDDHCPDCRK